MTYVLQVILPAVITLIVGIVVWRLLETRMNTLTEGGRLPQDTGNALRILLRWVLGITVALVVATIFGVKMTSLWATLSALFAMIAIGLFAGWSLISSLLAAIVIMIWRPFRAGQDIELVADGISGRVIELNMMFSSIADADGNRIEIPNAQMLQKIIKVKKPRPGERP